MIEQTLAIIKPDGMKHMEEIINIITTNDLVIKNNIIKQLDKETLREHYAHILDKPFYPTLEAYMTSDPVLIMILEGESAVNRLRFLMGPTDSATAPKDTIRGKFGTDKTFNCIHGSDSVQNAEIEINRFFKEKSKVKTKNRKFI